MKTFALWIATPMAGACSEDQAPGPRWQPGEEEETQKAAANEFEPSGDRTGVTEAPDEPIEPIRDDLVLTCAARTCRASSMVTRRSMASLTSTHDFQTRAANHGLARCRAFGE